jgi:hypothetical protein
MIEILWRKYNGDLQYLLINPYEVRAVYPVTSAMDDHRADIFFSNGDRISVLETYEELKRIFIKEGVVK